MIRRAPVKYLFYAVAAAFVVEKRIEELEEKDSSTKVDLDKVTNPLEGLVTNCFLCCGSGRTG